MLITSVGRFWGGSSPGIVPKAVPDDLDGQAVPHRGEAHAVLRKWQRVAPCQRRPAVELRISFPYFSSLWSFLLLFGPFFSFLSLLVLFLSITSFVFFFFF